MFDLSPDGQRGIVDYGNRLFENLDWLEPTEAKPVPVNLAVAEWPSWSPDGQSIALVGALSDDGRKGIDRLDIPKDIYLMQPDNLRLRLLVSKVTEARTPRWSPDSRWLLVPMRFDQARLGLWLVDTNGGNIYPLLQTGGQPTGLYVLMREIPQVSVQIIQSGQAIGGIGEVAVPPLAPSLANAYFRATGTRLRTLPMFPAAGKNGGGGS